VEFEGRPSTVKALTERLGLNEAIPSEPLPQCSSEACPTCATCQRLSGQAAQPVPDELCTRDARICRLLRESMPGDTVSRQFLAHSIATGVVAERLADVYGVDAGVAGAAGLLHDLGRIGMWISLGRPYARLMSRSFSRIPDVLAAEVRAFGIDHCQAGQLISAAWGFPDDLHDAIANHHDKPDAANLAGLIQLSCRLADAFLFESVRHCDTLGPGATAEAFAPPWVWREMSQRKRDIENRIVTRLQCPCA
jgi:putative nucleotidyltransferase with HDIG domain